MNKNTCSLIILSVVIALGIFPSLFTVKVHAQQTLDITKAGGTKPFGGEKIGSVTIEPNGHTVHITANVTSAPGEGKVYEGWLVDAGGSGYTLDLGEFAKNGTLAYKETLVDPYTYTQFMITEEPFEDKDPNASAAFGGTELQAPFNQ
jgi:hypothetical protein